MGQELLTGTGAPATSTPGVDLVSELHFTPALPLCGDIRQTPQSLVIEGVASRGGQATVFKARTSGGMLVAVKAFERGEECELEWRTLETFSNFRVLPQAFASGTVSVPSSFGACEKSCIVEEWLEGDTLAKKLRRMGRKMTVEEALSFFQNIPSIKRKLQTLFDVGLGYIRLGQPATTLSGGEAQRVKLATELSKRSTGKTLYILDEPTTGLHMADVDKLITILQRLASGGNTIIVIEHNLDVIKCADYIVDLGPEGGDEGGTIVALGTPEEVAENKSSYTGIFLKKALERHKND